MRLEKTQLCFILAASISATVFSAEVPFAHKCHTSYDNSRVNNLGFSGAVLAERIICDEPFATMQDAAQLKRALALPVFGDDVYLASAVWKVARGNASQIDTLVPLLANKHFVKKTYPRSDKGRREAQAELLVSIQSHLDSHPTLLNRVEKLLFVGLADAQASLDFFRNHPKKYQALKSDAHIFLNRIENLLSGNRNQLALSALAELSLGANSSMGMRCKNRYFKLKSLRKLRKYQDAHAEVGPILASCPEPWRIKSHYLGAMLQHIRPQANAEALFTDFQKRYANHSYADDVYYWHARFYRLTDPAKYAGMLTKQLKMFPDGDQYVQSAMELAFYQLGLGNSTEGILILHKLRTYPHLKLMERDMVNYWYARANIQPNPMLSKSIFPRDSKAFARGQQLLWELALERPSNYYGVLARNYLKALGVSSAGKNSSPRVLYGNLNQSLKRLRGNPPENAQKAIALGRAGLRVAAKLEMDALLGSGELKGKLNQVFLADVARQQGDFELSHKLLRSLGMAELDGAPDFAPDSLWALGYPRGYEKNMIAATSKHGIPRQMLEGLMREESAFEPRALSWAGAYGLCQLMPQTAKDVARYLGKTDFEVESLFEPATAIEFGAAHLGWLQKKMEHPFLALASYNAGVGNIGRTLDALGSTSVPIDFVIERLSNKQTRNYVKRVSSSWAYYALSDNQPIQVPMMVSR